MVITIYYLISVILALSAFVVVFRVAFLKKISPAGTLNISFYLAMVLSMFSSLVAFSNTYDANAAYDRLIRKASESLSKVDISSIKFEAYQPDIFIFWGTSIVFFAIGWIIMKKMIRLKADAPSTGKWDLDKYKEK